MAIVLVRGSGDVGSAVAHVLFRAGHAVILQDRERPAHSRRGMAFTDALFTGSAELEGVLAKRARDRDDLAPMLHCHRAIPTTDLPFDAALAAIAPDVLVDARMRKHQAPEPIRGLAPLTVALGPDLEAGNTADVVVETAWGESLGRVLVSGRSSPLAGEPREIGGHTRDRFVYAAQAGTFRTELGIDDPVREGDVIATLDGQPLRAPLSGWLRGISHDGALVLPGNKLIEVDPGKEPESAHGLGERPRKIAQGVSAAIADISELARH